MKNRILREISTSSFARSLGRINGSLALERGYLFVETARDFSVSYYLVTRGLIRHDIRRKSESARLMSRRYGARRYAAVTDAIAPFMSRECKLNVMLSLDREFPEFPAAPDVRNSFVVAVGEQGDTRDAGGVVQRHNLRK